MTAIGTNTSASTTISYWTPMISEISGEDTVAVELVGEIQHPDFVSVELRFIVPGLEPIEVEGIAKRDPVDRVNEELALTLAYGRALNKISNKLLKKAEGMIKHEDDVRAYRAVQRDRARRAAQLEARRAKRAAAKEA